MQLPVQEPEQEFELPEDMDLDGEAGGEDEEAAEGDAGEEPEEETGRFPEQPSAPEEAPAGATEEAQPETVGDVLPFQYEDPLQT